MVRDNLHQIDRLGPRSRRPHECATHNAMYFGVSYNLMSLVHLLPHLPQNRIPLMGSGCRVWPILPMVAAYLLPRI